MVSQPYALAYKFTLVQRLRALPRALQLFDEMPRRLDNRLWRQLFQMPTIYDVLVLDALAATPRPVIHICMILLG
jgi:hypothetical protein